MILCRLALYKGFTIKSKSFEFQTSLIADFKVKYLQIILYTNFVLVTCFTKICDSEHRTCKIAVSILFKIKNLTTENNGENKQLI